MAKHPGTVSQILWHFTGGPRWNSAKKCQESRRKPADEAYEAFLAIFRSKELHLGQYREVVKVRFPRPKAMRKAGVPTTSTVQMESSRVCCLSDIPIAHLAYHAGRYGKLALGFHRRAALRHGFNPVFYSPHDASVLRSLRRVFTRLNKVDLKLFKKAIENLERETEDLECDQGHAVEVDLAWEIADIETAAGAVGQAVSSARESLEEFLAFVKTFDKREFSTIYCEREWRSTKAFPFTFQDLAMIVLPDRPKGNSYFSKFLREARALKLPRSIPVVPWEDLVEH
jgi:hypothetical protein